MISKQMHVFLMDIWDTTARSKVCWLYGGVYDVCVCRFNWATTERKPCDVCGVSIWRQVGGAGRGRGGGFVSVQSAVLNNVYIYSFTPPPPPPWCKVETVTLSLCLESSKHGRQLRKRQPRQKFFQGREPRGKLWANFQQKKVDVPLTATFV